MGAFLDLLDGVLDAAMMLLALAILMALFAVVVLYVIDVTQNSQAIRKNYPVIGRLRYVFEHLGVFFRQYFFAMDREELPFNRAQRAWVARAAKKQDSTIAFGSTKPLNRPGDIFFLNSAFPPTKAEIEAHRPTPLTFGEGWNNTHPAYPPAARHGWGWREPDLTWMHIQLLQRLGLATQVRLPAPLLAQAASGGVV